MTLAAFYQCYDKPRAFEHTLQSFRTIYPGSELWIVNDGGNPKLQDIATQYGATHYEYQPNIGGGVSLTWENTDTIHINVLAWLSRLRSFILSTSATHFVLLEDDVWIKKTTDVTKLGFDINGCNKRSLLPPPIYGYIKSKNPSTTTAFYGGCGGCVFRIDTLRRILTNVSEYEEHVRTYCTIKKCIASDAIISFLVLVYGGTIGTWDGYAEMWYGDIKQRLAEDRVEILHQYKALY